MGNTSPRAVVVVVICIPGVGSFDIIAVVDVYAALMSELLLFVVLLLMLVVVAVVVVRYGVHYVVVVGCMVIIIAYVVDMSDVDMVVGCGGYVDNGGCVGVCCVTVAGVVCDGVDVDCWWLYHCCLCR